MKKFLSYLFVLVFGVFSLVNVSFATGENTPTTGTSSQTGSQKEDPCDDGIKLNTKVPFIGNCIHMGTGKATDGNITVNETDAFPVLISAMMKILITVILSVSFLMIIVAGLLMTTGGYKAGNYKQGVDLIMKVAGGLALLGLSGVILKMINPNFFL